MKKSTIMFLLLVISLSFSGCNYLENAQNNKVMQLKEKIKNFENGQDFLCRLNSSDTFLVNNKTFYLISGDVEENKSYISVVSKNTSQNIYLQGCKLYTHKKDVRFSEINY